MTTTNATDRASLLTLAELTAGIEVFTALGLKYKDGDENGIAQTMFSNALRLTAEYERRYGLR